MNRGLEDSTVQNRHLKVFKKRLTKGLPAAAVKDAIEFQGEKTRVSVPGIGRCDCLFHRNFGVEFLHKFLHWLVAAIPIPIPAQYSISTA